MSTARVAAVQAAPAFLDREATVARVEEWTARAAGEGAQLVAFPESFVPGYPLWNLVLAPIDQHRLFTELHRQAVDVPGPTSDALGAIARRHGVYLSLGVTERHRLSAGTLYNSNLLFDPSGALVNLHRKLVPTWAEKLSWANGDGRGLRVVQTPFGRVGALICGENLNSLARYALLAQGEQIHISTYPPAAVFFRAAGDLSHEDIARTVEIRAAAHAIEGKVFTLVSSAVLTPAAAERSSAGDDDLTTLLLRSAAPASYVVHPSGALCSERLVGDEGVVVADIDLDEAVVLKQLHDVTGGYQRPDVLRLVLDRQAREPLGMATEPTEPAETGT